MKDKFDVEIYEKENLRKPFVDFYDSLDKNTKARIIRHLMLLEQYGNEIGNKLSKKLDKNIYELRIVGSINVRILYFFHKNRKIIITNAFIKKTQKTPKKEIILANIYRKAWILKENNYENE